MTTDQRQATLDTVDAFFQAFGSGDSQALLDVFAEKVDFTVHGSADVPWTGHRSTRDEIAEFFGLFSQLLTAPESFDINGRIADGEDAVVFGTCVFGVLATGRKFTNNFALHFTAVDGRIVRYHMYEDSHAIAGAFAA